jgi:hypothetical protein
MHAAIAQSRLRNYFLLGAVEGIFSLMLLLSLPKDPDSSWLFGYSPARVFLLITILAFIIFFLGFSIRTKRNPNWANHWLAKTTDQLQKDRNCEILISTLLGIFLLGTWFLISTYSQSSYQTPVRLIATKEIFQAYALRLVPFIFWGTAVSLQTLLFIQFCGVGTKEKYYRAISNLSILLIPTLILIFFVVQMIDPNYYKFITNEDHIVEWLTIICLILAGIFSFMIAIRQRNQLDRKFWFYLIFALACVIFALEEMSWGQRIFNIQSPEFFLENSDQQEINIHNVLQEWFSFRTKHVAAWVLFVYGTCLPIFAVNQKVRNFFDCLGISNPPLALAPGFFLSAILMIDVFSGKEEEVGEFCFSLCLFLFMLLEYLSQTPIRQPQNQPRLRTLHHQLLQKVFIVFVTIGIIIDIGLASFAIGR